MVELNKLQAQKTSSWLASSNWYLSLGKLYLCISHVGSIIN